MTVVSKDLNVIIMTPFGAGGRGGMDKLSDSIAAFMAKAEVGINVRLVATYGQGSRWLMPLHFLKALLTLTFARLVGRVDLVHINVAGGGSLYRKGIIALWCQVLGVPYIVHVHGSRLRESWPAVSAIKNALPEFLFANSRRIVVLGKVWADYVAGNLPRVSERIIVLPNATEARPLRVRKAAPEGGVHISFMGALGERKGSLLLIEALRRVKSDVPWRATIAGNVDVAGHRRAVEQAGLSEKVQLTGWLGPEDVDALLRETDILALPSFAENLPMVIIEGFAQGIPVVSTPVGAIPEVVEDGVNGLLVAAGDIDALAAALAKLVRSPRMREEMGRAGWESHRRNFENSYYMERLQEIWWEAVGEECRRMYQTVRRRAAPPRLAQELVDRAS